MQATATIEASGDVSVSGFTGPVPWWSFTKTVLATAALRLVDDGLLELDKPLGDRRFNLRQLLRHEAGLCDYGSSTDYHADVAAGETPWTVERLFTVLDADRLRYEPGAGWAYSNVGYLMVAQLVGRVSGLPLRAALDRLVLGPAKLTTARLATTPSDLDGVQMGDAEVYHPGWVFHGLVVGTAADAARLLWVLTNGGLLKPDSFAAMLQGRLLPEHRGMHPDPAYGLGLMMWATDPMDHPLGHLGEGPGSSIAVLAQGRRAAAVWTARSSGLDAEAHAVRLLT